jgi:malate dehydrogenase (oxaloacetate-decarboxylating)
MVKLLRGDRVIGLPEKLPAAQMDKPFGPCGCWQGTWYHQGQKAFLSPVDRVTGSPEDSMPLSPFYDVLRSEDGSRYIEPYVTGYQLLRLPLLNKGTAFTAEERRLLDLQGLLPTRIDTLESQVDRAYHRYRALLEPIEKHVYLRLLQDNNEVLFFALVSRNLEEMLPVIYTPTVGEAVQRFSELYQNPRGLMLSPGTQKDTTQAVDNLPLDDVRMIVATDSSAILGIGDQGVGGMAISIGKLAIYTTAGGIGPDKVLPVKLDVGTNRASLRENPNYLGSDAPRLTGEPYRQFIDQFVTAARNRYPKAVIQWEDFGKDTAFEILERYRHVIPSFNDDIQGTGAMALAGVISACRIKGEALADQRIVISGAGAGGIGVAWALLMGLQSEGLTRSEALERVVVLDSRGVLATDREMESYKQAYAQDAATAAAWSTTGGIPGLLEAVQGVKATVLIGLSGQAAQFTREIVDAVSENTSRPVIFPLSNPTVYSEALPEDLLAWTEGQAIVAVGSPFPPVVHNGVTFEIGQGNNAFVFPGIGFGTVLSQAQQVTDNMVLTSAFALADYTASLHPDRVYPPVAELKAASIEVAARVMAAAVADGVAAELTLHGLDHEALVAHVQERFWLPQYLPYRLPR